MAILCHHNKVSVVPLNNVLVSLKAIGRLETNIISSEAESGIASSTAEDGFIAIDAGVVSHFYYLS